MEIIKQRFAEHITLAQQVAESRILEQVAESAEIIRRALQNGKKVLFCGNGGSAADSQHLAAEFVGRFQKERNGLPAIALTVDTSILTAVANDYGYDTVFARQVQALGSADVASDIRIELTVFQRQASHIVAGATYGEV